MPNYTHHSEKLTAYIQREIKTAGGQIDFARFMELALYTPDLGYYMTHSPKWGRGGDFVTAPEISPLFAQCIARQCQPILEGLHGGDMLELGAGSGVFAKDVLLELEKLGTLPRHYFILEMSPALRDRQGQRFQKECPHLLSRISWIDSLPQAPMKGIIFANEVFDAMPIHRFTWHQGEVKECYVAFENKKFVWREDSPSAELEKRVRAISEEYPFPDFYRSEVSLTQSTWMMNMANALDQGVILLVDYGYGRREYYHPDRRDGTLMCFYQHQAHHDPLIWVGLQDITAHVDFTTLAESADQAGLQVTGFTSQAAFLLACGLLDIAQAGDQAIKTLILPSQMGELVKAMALTKQVDEALVGFKLQDRRRDL